MSASQTRGTGEVREEDDVSHLSYSLTTKQPPNCLIALSTTMSKLTKGH